MASTIHSMPLPADDDAPREQRRRPPAGAVVGPDQPQRRRVDAVDGGQPDRGRRRRHDDGIGRSAQRGRAPSGAPAVGAAGTRWRTTIVGTWTSSMTSRRPSDTSGSPSGSPLSRSSTWMIATSSCCEVVGDGPGRAQGDGDAGMGVRIDRRRQPDAVRQVVAAPAIRRGRWRSGRRRVDGSQSLTMPKRRRWSRRRRRSDAGIADRHVDSSTRLGSGRGVGPAGDSDGSDRAAQARRLTQE